MFFVVCCFKLIFRFRRYWIFFVTSILNDFLTTSILNDFSTRWILISFEINFSIFDFELLTANWKNFYCLFLKFVWFVKIFSSFCVSLLSTSTMKVFFRFRTSFFCVVKNFVKSDFLKMIFNVNINFWNDFCWNCVFWNNDLWNVNFDN